MGAVSGGHAETIALLLDRGADVEVTTKDGFNALWYAIWEPDDSKEKANKERIIRLLPPAPAVGREVASLKRIGVRSYRCDDEEDVTRRGEGRQRRDG